MEVGGRGEGRGSLDRKVVCSGGLSLKRCTGGNVYGWQLGGKLLGRIGRWQLTKSLFDKGGACSESLIPKQLSK